MAHRHRHSRGPRLIAMVTAFIRSLTPPASGAERLHKSRRRKTGIGILTIGVTLAATCLAAFANAANPYTDATHITSGTATVNGDGTVSVHVTGTWNWGDLSGSSAQSKCENRYGVGWSVDWSGVSTSPTPGFSWSIKSTPATFFHVVTLDSSGNFVTSHAMDGVYPFSGPCTAQELALDPTGPSGPWSADFVYPSVATVPPQLCANFYDLHGSPGKVSNSKQLDPTQNNDNSIKTNSFDPTNGNGFCFAPTFVNPVQHLVGHIYDCSNGATTTEVSGGTLSATGPTTVASQPNPLDDPTAAVGNYTVAAGAPTGFHFVDCGSGATINTPTSATEGVSVPSNGTGTATFYVAPDTQTLVVHIYDCSNGASTTEISGGTISAAGPTTVGSQANPVNASVDAGSYTVTAGAPANYHFVDCGSGATINTPTSATEGTTVPSNGTGTATFYVAPDTQALAGHIYDCSNGASTTEISGGTISAAGPTTVGSQANPLNASVDAGSYTVTAGAPANHHFVDCGSGATINTPTSATEAVSVPSNGTGVATFYVVPDVQTLVVHIYDCSNGATTTEVSGGTISAAGPTSVASQGNPATVSVDAGSYTVTADAPANHHFVDCGSGATITTPTSASEGVSVPSNGTGTATFYVAPNPPPPNPPTPPSPPPAPVQNLVVHIYDCSNGATTTEISGGTISAAGPTNVASQGNPVNASNVDPGQYVVTAGAPSGYHFVECGSGATITTPTNASEGVSVPSNGTGTGTFYVAPNVPVLSVAVDKTNDADRNGTFGDDETGTAGNAVTFRVTITNNSAVAVVIDSIDDVWPGASAIAPDCETQVVGTTLPANGGSVSCVFTVDNYVPTNAEGAKVNTATVVVHEAGHPSNSTSGADTSTVRGTEVLGVEITRTPETPAAPTAPAAPLAQTLPRTGAGHTAPLFLLGIVLIALGAMLTWINNPVSALLAGRERRRRR